MSVAGDELFCSNQAVIERLAPEAVCTTLVVRVADAGTVTRAMNCARCFRSIVPSGSVCVAPEVCDNETARSGFAVDFAFAIGATFLQLNASVLAAAGCQGAAMLSRYQAIVNELEVVAAEKEGWPSLDAAGDAGKDGSGVDHDHGTGSSNINSSSGDIADGRSSVGRRPLFAYPASLPDYSNIRNIATEPVEPLGLLEMVVNPKDLKKKK